MTGARIFQLNVSDGGVPKRPVHEAEITTAGVHGDRQNDLENHGGPDRAVCIYSLERIQALQAEGHPIFPGSTGENLTVSGVDWDAVVPGLRLKLGHEVVLEVVSYTMPCGTISASFDAGRVRRIAQKHHPGWSRVYARVIQAGRARVGDAVSMDATSIEE